MSWLGEKYDELTGKNQKVSEKTINSEYNTAYAGAREGYKGIEQFGNQMMQADSAMNMSERNRQFEGAADNNAEASRLAQRNVAMGGGGNSTATAFNVADQSNKTTASTQNAYNQYLSGTQKQGVGMVSGALNNQTQMNQTQMNAVSNQRLANNQIDSQATGFAANMIGRGVSAYFTGGASELKAQSGGYMRGMYQEGGDVNAAPEGYHYMPNGELMENSEMQGYQHGGEVNNPYGNRGGMLSQVMGPDGIPMNIKTRIGGQTIG
tara:strand:- start:14411 stop:15205 length:795 start_codon:yes stop_codon:yes gene_type:complete